MSGSIGVHQLPAGDRADPGGEGEHGMASLVEIADVSASEASWDQLWGYYMVEDVIVQYTLPNVDRVGTVSNERGRPGPAETPARGPHGEPIGK